MLTSVTGGDRKTVTISRFLVRARRVANIKLYSSYVPVDPLSPLMLIFSVLGIVVCRFRSSVN